jgi:catechol 2,3-dioxygenase-like lactoylglutathione lyase family enzyme
MELASVRIFVTDLPAAARFYADVVGLEQVWSSADAVVFGRKPMLVIEAADAEAHAEGLVARFTGVAFATDDAAALYRELASAGVPTHGAPERQPWGGILLHAKDPSGNTVTFLQAPAKGSAAKGSDP